jgi:hypothetical protein
MDVEQKQSDPTVKVLLGVFLAATIFVTYLTGGFRQLADDLSRDEAESRIESVIAACKTGNRYVVADRYTRARETMSLKLSTTAAFDFNNRLDNAMKVYGCKL